MPDCVHVGVSVTLIPAVTVTLTVWLLDADADADDECELLTDADLLAEPVTLPDALLVSMSLALTDTVPDCVLDGVSVTLTLAVTVTLTVWLLDADTDADADDEYELLTGADLLAEPVTLPDALLVSVALTSCSLTLTCFPSDTSRLYAVQLGSGAVKIGQALSVVDFKMHGYNYNGRLSVLQRTCTSSCYVLSCSIPLVVLCVSC